MEVDVGVQGSPPREEVGEEGGEDDELSHPLDPELCSSTSRTPLAARLDAMDANIILLHALHDTVSLQTRAGRSS